MQKIITYGIINGVGALAHLVERFHGMEEVRSSNLLCSTIFCAYAIIYLWQIFPHLYRIGLAPNRYVRDVIVAYAWNLIQNVI